MRQRCRLGVLLGIVLGARGSAAQTFVNPVSAGVVEPRTMGELAADVAREYRTANRDSLLDVIFRLQIIQRDFVGARRSLAELRALRIARTPSPLSRAINVQYEIFASALAGHSPADGNVASEFAAAFDSVLGSLDNRTAALVADALVVPANVFAATLEQLVATDNGKPTISRASVASSTHSAIRHARSGGLTPSRTSASYRTCVISGSTMC